MLIGCVVPVFAAEETADEEQQASLVTVSDQLTFISYEAYLSKYPDREEARATSTFTIDATDYDKAKTDAEVTVDEILGKKCLITPNTGNTSWTFNVEEEGFYTINVDYCPVSEKTASIERIFYINGNVPFKEGRYMAMPKTWSFRYQHDPSEGREGLFEKDAVGNEMRPECVADTMWMNYVMKDSDGYYTTPFEFYFRKGENTITFESIRDEVAIGTITFTPYVALPTYEDVLADYSANGYTAPTDVEPVHIDAEAPTDVSDYTVYPISDESSAITEPQSANLRVLNTIGSEKWSLNGQWVRYSFTIEKGGLYTICPRFKQTLKEGIYVARTVRIDGEVPFEEAKAVRFNYGKNWQVGPLTDEEGNPYLFYLDEGKHTLELEVSLGDMSTILLQANNILTSINDDYLEITKLTGQDADANRDYGFARVMPETVADLSYQYQNINLLTRMISATSGTKSQLTGTISVLAELLRKMGSDESKIASNLVELKDQISSLGEWISDMTGQSLELDYILIQPADASLPKANAGFFKSFAFEFKKFIASFFTNYDSITLEGQDESGYSGELVVWTIAGREQAIIMNNLIANGFTKETNVSVNLKLVANGTLLPAILAGTAPDVSLDGATPIDLALRGALIGLNDFDTFDEVTQRFAPSALIPLTLYGETYAIPTGQAFSVMFYRKDILADLGLEVPETWDELMAMVPVLQFNNMDIGITADFATYIYQNGGEYFKDEGMAINFDSPEVLDAFESLSNFFTQYSLPLQFNAVNRMKTGQMPICVATYTTYNTLVVSAPEIAGLWEFAQCPGFRREDGTVDHTVVTSSSGIFMTKGAKDRELAWDFIDWYSDKEYQVDFSNEMVTLLGPSAKQAVANLEAFQELPWTAKEFSVLKEALDNSTAVPAYPGDYMVLRYLNFAFNEAYTDGADPSDALLEYIAPIDKELTRKRKEFHLMLEDEWQAVKEFTGLESYTAWREFAAENSIEDYQDWMKENGVSVSGFEDWTKQTRDGETELSYKEWIQTN